jgi:hypothetical protein
LTTTSLLPPVMACHHWISVTAKAGLVRAEVKVSASAAAAVTAANRRIGIAFLQVKPSSSFRAITAADDVQVTSTEW